MRERSARGAGVGRAGVTGLGSGPADPRDVTEDEVRSWTGARPRVQLIGEGSLTARMWTYPAIDILGIDAPSTIEAANRLVPWAKAKVSMRIPPGQDPEQAAEALTKHLESNVPWGADVTITPEA